MNIRYYLWPILACMLSLSTWKWFCITLRTIHIEPDIYWMILTYIAIGYRIYRQYCPKELNGIIDIHFEEWEIENKKEEVIL